MGARFRGTITGRGIAKRVTGTEASGISVDLKGPEGGVHVRLAVDPIKFDGKEDYAHIEILPGRSKEGPPVQIYLAPVGAQFREFLSGTTCPVCRSTEIEADRPCGNTANGIWQEVKCFECKSEWQEEYVLVNCEIRIRGEKGDAKPEAQPELQGSPSAGDRGTSKG